MATNHGIIRRSPRVFLRTFTFAKIARNAKIANNAKVAGKGGEASSTQKEQEQEQDPSSRTHHKRHTHTHLSALPALQGALELAVQTLDEHAPVPHAEELPRLRRDDRVGPAALAILLSTPDRFNNTRQDGTARHDRTRFNTNTNKTQHNKRVDHNQTQQNTSALSQIKKKKKHGLERARTQHIRTCRNQLPRDRERMRRKEGTK